MGGGGARGIERPQAFWREFLFSTKYFKGFSFINSIRSQHIKPQHSFKDILVSIPRLKKLCRDRQNMVFVAFKEGMRDSAFYVILTVVLGTDVACPHILRCRFNRVRAAISKHFLKGEQKKSSGALHPTWHVFYIFEGETNLVGTT